MTVWLGFLALLLVAGPARAEVNLPPGFTTEVYVTGQGFDTSGERGVSGIPSVGTLGVDAAGDALHVAHRSPLPRGRHRGPLGHLPDPRGWGATDARKRDPLPLRTAATQPPDRRGVGPGPGVGHDVRPRAPAGCALPVPRREAGALRRRASRRGRNAGPAPSRGSSDRPRGRHLRDRPRGRAIVRLDARGNLVNPRHAAVLASPHADHGRGRQPLGRRRRDRARRRSARATARSYDSRPTAARSRCSGPLPAGFSQSPGGALFVVQRRTGQLFALMPDGRRLDFATTRNGSFLRAPRVRPRHAGDGAGAGIAGDLFVVLVSRSLWLLNEVVRISGPFDEWVRPGGQPAGALIHRARAATDDSLGSHSGSLGRC